MFNFLRKHSSKNAIIFLQETHSTANCEKIWTDQWASGKEKIYFSHGTSNSTGVLIAFREGLSYGIESPTYDLEEHFLILKAVVQDSHVMSENELCDIFRVRNPDVKLFTWRNKNPLIQRRLDYFILNEDLQNSIEIIGIIPSVQSDHSVLKLKITPINERTRGP